MRVINYGLILTNFCFKLLTMDSFEFYSRELIERTVGAIKRASGARKRLGSQPASANILLHWQSCLPGGFPSQSMITGFLIQNWANTEYHIQISKHFSVRSRGGMACSRFRLKPEPFRAAIESQSRCIRKLRTAQFPTSAIMCRKTSFLACHRYILLNIKSKFWEPYVTDVIKMRQYSIYYKSVGMGEQPSSRFRQTRECCH